jgi:(p)ppGpp synthase/HD superfamily hydrolase
MNTLEAYQLASKLHTGQVDQSGRPYIEHLTRVFLRVQAAGGDQDQQIAALLHDAIEDGKTSAAQLTWLGVPSDALDLIDVF